MGHLSYKSSFKIFAFSFRDFARQNPFRADTFGGAAPAPAAPGLRAERSEAS
jgi:hypothetical protein